MKNKFSLPIFLSIISLLGVLILYPSLPEQIPIHYNFQWEVDGYGPKYAALLLGALPLVLCGLFYILLYIDPKREQMGDRIYDKIQTAVIILMIAVNWICLASVRYPQKDVSVWISVAIGVVFIIIGNYLPKVKPNYFLGIRTPWTLSSDVVWRKTHRLGGYLFILIGCVIMSTAVVNESWYAYVVGSILVIGVTAIYGYSYLIYRRNNK